MNLIKLVLFLESLRLFCASDSTSIMGTFAGTGTWSATGNGGPASSATLEDPFGIYQDTAGVTYIADNSDCTVRKVSTTGIITAFAGISGSLGNTGNGGPATSATFGAPYGVFVNTMGLVYVSDSASRVIRTVSTGGTVNAFAGITGTSGKGDTGNGVPATSAAIDNVAGLWGNSVGVIYVINYIYSTVRAIDTNNIMTLFAGVSTTSPSFSGNGGYATSANLKRPCYLFGATTGEVYISDTGNNQVRSVSTSGLITNFLGLSSGSSGSTASGGAATSTGIFSPQGAFVSSDGDVYVSDGFNYIVRKVTKSTGIVDTYAGRMQLQASVASQGDGGSATSARFVYPLGVGRNSLSVYISDQISQVREVTLPGSPSVTPTAVPSLSPTTAAPSMTPTSCAPTMCPTLLPSSVPSPHPSSHPTIVPTIAPSDSPTARPTTNPTLSPSVIPSAVPSLGPSIVPTEMPSVEPTMFPSVIPSVGPTVTSTVSPTLVPSLLSTVVPTVDPSLTPTVGPTLSPSLGLSASPSTSTPTKPTIAPSRMPSKKPVRALITSAPTFATTVAPTATPTNGAVTISFNTSISLQNVSASVLDGTSQTAVAVSVASTLNTSLSSVTVTSQQTIGQGNVRRLSEASVKYEVLVTLNVHTSTRDFPDTMNRNGSYLYNKLTTILSNSVKSNEFTVTLRSMSAILHADATLHVGVVNVTVSGYEDVAHVSYNDVSKSGHSDHNLTEGEFAGIVIGILGGALLLIGCCLGYFGSIGMFGGQGSKAVVVDGSTEGVAGAASFDAVVARTDVEGGI